MEKQTIQDEKVHAYNNLIDEGKNLEEILAMLERAYSKVIKTEINQDDKKKFYDFIQSVYYKRDALFIKAQTIMKEIGRYNKRKLKNERNKEI
ncbi:MAG: hypothetical protein HWN79_06235 [Candidatus Lokiarchaeota archaeon]|nr:hypothetical protein [Candidatus Lokiarchaeota archaeon]